MKKASDRSTFLDGDDDRVAYFVRLAEWIEVGEPCPHGHILRGLYFTAVEGLLCRALYTKWATP